MNTTITEETREDEDFKPALYRGADGMIVLATTPNGGVVLHSGRTSCRHWGYVFPSSGSNWANILGWTRITQPQSISIRFTP